MGWGEGGGIVRSSKDNNYLVAKNADGCCVDPNAATLLLLYFMPQAELRASYRIRANIYFFSLC